MIATHVVCLHSLSSAIIQSNPYMADQGEVTLLLNRLSSGDRSAESLLLPYVYLDLHRLAMGKLRSERPDHTLQATALVNEVYLRLCIDGSVVWNGRAHFFCLAARVMRNVLADYARSRNALRRGGGALSVNVTDVLLVSPDNLELTIQIDDLLKKLALEDPRQAQVVEMKFFAGMTDADIATALDVAERTVKRNWFMARAWLHSQIAGENA